MSVPRCVSWSSFTGIGESTFRMCHFTAGKLVLAGGGKAHSCPCGALHRTALVSSWHGAAFA